jgi:hypothetical protein
MKARNISVAFNVDMYGEEIRVTVSRPREDVVLIPHKKTLR